MDQHCRREVIGLHQFFQHWFNGEIENSEDVLERIRGALAVEFRIISPDGRQTDRAHLIEAVTGSHGASRRRGQPIRIWIEGYEGRAVSDDTLVATYQEWQTATGGKRGKLATAVFRKRASAPNGVEWVHVHETWLTPVTPQTPASGGS